MPIKPGAPTIENVRSQQDLETKIKTLEAENTRLIEHGEDSFLLGIIAENISISTSPDNILSFTLEQIARHKDIPYCAFCDLSGDQALLLQSYATFREAHSPEDQIILAKDLIEVLTEGPLLLSGDDVPPQGITLKIEGSSFIPKTVLILPISARLMDQGILLIADNILSQGRLSGQIALIERVLAIVTSRLDNLSLINELQHLNTALNIEVDRRAGELRDAALQHSQVEGALSRQRSIISNLAEAAPVGITIIDKNDNITFANSRAEAALGLTKSDITGRQFDSPAWKITDYDGNSFPHEELPFQQVKETGQPVYNVRHAIEWPDGRRILLAINAAPIYNDDFDFDGIVAVVEDVTEQILVDTEFHRLQNFNASIVQNISEGIVVQDSDGTFSYVNPTASKMLGYHPEEILGKHWTDITPEDQHLIIQKADERRQQGISDRYEAELRKKSGERFPVRISGSPRIDPRTDEFLGNLAVFSDITERKQAETLNQIQRKLALQLSAAVGLESVLHLCLNAAITSTKMDAGCIFLVGQNSGDLYLASSMGFSEDFIKVASFFKLDSPQIQIMMRGEPAYIMYSDLALPEDDFRMQEKLVSAAALPIRFEGQTIAFLNVASRKLNTIQQPNKNILEAIAAQIGSAVARAQAEEQLRQRADQLKLINDIGEKIAAVLELESVLSRTARLIQEGFGYEHVSLFLTDPTKKRVIMKTISGDFETLFPPAHTLALGEGLVGMAALENKTTLANDIETSPHYTNYYPNTIHTRSELSVPIQIGGEVVGVIDAQSIQLNAFDENDIIVMETLADQVAVAIHNANLHEAVQRELAQRTRIESALRESEEKFRNIVQSSPMALHMYQLEPNNRLVFLDANPAADLILGVDCQQFVGKTIEEAFPALSETEIPEQYRLTAETGEPWHTDQIDYDENEIRGAFEVYAFQTEKNKVAVFFVDITERKQAENRIQRQLRRLAALNQIDAAITSNLGLDRTIDILLEQTVRQLNIDAAAILLYKPPTQTLEYYALNGFTHLNTPLSSVRLGQAYAGRVALERQSIQTSDTDESFQTSIHNFVNEGFRSYCGVPLITKGQVKGVLEVFDRNLMTPHDGWLSFLETLAGQAAIAIDSAELVEYLERSNLELRLAYNNTLEGWAKALELRDFETQGHSQRVTELTIQLAQAVGIPDDELVHVQRGALLHDIGKMAVPDHILLKQGRLSDDEWDIMRQHPVYAYEMLSPIEFLRPALDIPYYHHEKWDGSGYPNGLKGEAIPLAARVFAIIDVWDALSSDRPYRTAWPENRIVEKIRAEQGKHFDPHVVEAFLSITRNP